MATQHESPPPPLPPQSSMLPPPTPKPNTNTPSSLTPSKQNISPNLKDTDSLDKGKGNLYVIMDSNRKFINFKELLAGEFNNKLTPIVTQCDNWGWVEKVI